MTPLLTLLDYNLEIEWALTWFPTRASANLKEVRMRGGTITHRTSDPAFTVGNKVGHLLAQGDETDKTEDSLEPNELVRASLSVGVTPGGIFEVDLEVRIGPTRRTKYLRLPPDARIPFMINVRPRSENPVILDTAAVFQGVCSTGSRLSLVDIAVRLVGP